MVLGVSGDKSEVTMIKRKCIAALVTSFIAIIITTTFFPIDTFLSQGRNDSNVTFGDILMISSYILGGVLLYGLPISILIELLTKNFKDARFFFALALHIIFGFLPIFLLWFFTIFSLTISVLFFITDELIKSQTPLDKN
jgi:hypothetical protein